jgi:predicted PurR-regulated permease PerM
MPFPDRKTANILVTVVLFSVVLGLAYLARAVIVIFCFAILFAYLVDPVVRFLQRHSLFFRDLRGPHVAEAYLVLLIFIALTVYGLAPGFLLRAAGAVQQLPYWSERISSGDIASDLASKNNLTASQEVKLRTFLVGHGASIRNVVQSAEQFATAAFGAVAVIPILAIFFLSSGEALANQLIRLISTEASYDNFRTLAAELHAMLQHYIRAKVTLGLLSFVYCSAALLALRFPHAIILGVLAGVLEFIPMAGWITAAATIITVGVLTHSHWLWMAGLLGLWRVLMDYWIAPRVLGHELEIPPLLAIFTLMVGATVGGLPGVYLSIPIVAALRVVWRHSANSPQQVEATAS